MPPRPPTRNLRVGRSAPRAMRRTPCWLAPTLAILVAACSFGGGPGPSPAASTVPGHSGGGEAFTEPELRLLLADRLGDLWYCDPDEFPLPVDELARMRERWPELLADAATLEAILTHEGLPPISGANLSDAQRLVVYRTWKRIGAVELELIGNGRYRFDYVARPVANAAQGLRTAGLITDSGIITVEQETPADEPICPICLPAGTPIDTPAGSIAVDRLRIGDRVWSLDAAGRRIVARVTALGSRAAPSHHEVVRLVLADGRSVTASPGHPLGDGRELGVLRAGDAVAGTRVSSVERVPYSGWETFDLAISGPTGLYLSDGIPLDTTLRSSSTAGADSSD